MRSRSSSKDSSGPPAVQPSTTSRRSKKPRNAPSPLGNTVHIPSPTPPPPDVGASAVENDHDDDGDRGGGANGDGSAAVGGDRGHRRDCGQSDANGDSESDTDHEIPSSPIIGSTLSRKRRLSVENTRGKGKTALAEKDNDVANGVEHPNERRTRSRDNPSR